jgi:uncharacterized protein
MLKLLNPLAWIELQMLFIPERSFRGDPSHVGLDYQDVFPVTSDGVTLHGWHMPEALGADKPSAKSVWLIFHGNGGNVGGRLDQYQEIHRRYGMPIVVVDYRGYGRSEGEPSEHGLYADARAAYDLVRQLHPNKKVIVFGRSLGGPVAAQLTSDVQPAVLVLEAAISSVRAMLVERIPWAKFTPIPLFLRSKFDTLAHVANLTTPTLILHGDADQTVSPDNSKRIYEALPSSTTKTIEIVTDGDHNGLDLVDPERYHHVLRSFLSDNDAL